MYQRTGPGQAPETTCGARTWPVVDEPEMMQVRLANGEYAYRETGRVLARETPDPYCPGHRGSPEPPPPPVHVEDMQHAYTAYMEMAARFAGQHVAAGPAAVAELPVPDAAAAAANAPPAGLPGPAPLSDDGFRAWMAELMRGAGNGG
jgi:hypothetical protein